MTNAPIIALLQAATLPADTGSGGASRVHLLPAGAIILEDRMRLNKAKRS